MDEQLKKIKHWQTDLGGQHRPMRRTKIELKLTKMAGLVIRKKFQSGQLNAHLFTWK